MGPAEEERQKQETRLGHFAAPKVPYIYDQTGKSCTASVRGSPGFLVRPVRLSYVTFSLV